MDTEIDPRPMTITPERLEEIERNLDDRLRSETTMTGHEPISTMGTRDLRNIVRLARRALELEQRLAAVEQTDERARARTAAKRSSRSLGD